MTMVITSMILLFDRLPFILTAADAALLADEYFVSVWKSREMLPRRVVGLKLRLVALPQQSRDAAIFSTVVVYLSRQLVHLYVNKRREKKQSGEREDELRFSHS